MQMLPFFGDDLNCVGHWFDRSPYPRSILGVALKEFATQCGNRVCDLFVIGKINHQIAGIRYNALDCPGFSRLLIGDYVIKCAKSL